MKRHIFLFFFLCLTGIAFGQDHHPNRCNTTEYNEKIYSAKPQSRLQHELLKYKIEQILLQKNTALDSSSITIPVVVHVVYHTEAENISDAQIYSQIDVLNEDFRRMNADSVNTPSMFKSLAADCSIEFCLAKRNMDTVTSTGIERYQTSVLAFPMDNSMKSSMTGGLDAWDPDKYLNLWVCNMAGNVLGYAQYPGGTDSTDGVVIHYYNFGRIGDLDPHYNLGRTATHEIGHWLDLYHIWGDDFGSCDGTDYVDDTPNAKDANYYCPNHPRLTICNSTGEMFMNYMDYSDDDCLNTYTHGQRDRMWAAIFAGRPGLLTSDGCSPIIGIEENEWLQEVRIFPNPGKGIFNIQARLKHPMAVHLRVTDILGNIVLQQEFTAEQSAEMSLNLTGNPNGLYFLQMISAAGSHSEKILLSH